VQILRQSSSQLDMQGYRPWATLGVVVGTAALLVAAGLRSPHLSTQHPASALAFVLLALLIGFCVTPRLAGRLRPVRKVRGGKGPNALLEQLPNDYYLINDLFLQNGRIDHIIVGPCGVVVVSTRRSAGRVECDGDRWSINGRPRQSYSRQARVNAMAVRKLLAARHPEFAREIVRSIVVFTNPRCELQLNKPTVAVVRADELLARVIELGLTRKMDRDLAYTAARRLAGGGPARFSASRPARRIGTAR
jgi:membrane protein implicated in regulation of membrane protease activity